MVDCKHGHGDAVLLRHLTLGEQTVLGVAPEILAKNKETTDKADTWSAGVLLHAMLSGLWGPTPRNPRPRVDSAIERGEETACSRVLVPKT